MPEDPKSQSIRLQAFEWLQQKSLEYDDVLPHKVLNYEFKINGERIPLIGARGIFKPKVISYYPISITTSPNSPYSDKIAGNVLIYKYRGTDPNHPDNVRLKKAMMERIPLIYFHGIVKGKYLSHFPVYIAGADDANLTFTVEADINSSKVWDSIEEGKVHEPLVDEVRRKYATTEVVIRLHQKMFREKVLIAYREHCSFCQLKHRELLDAAHIIEDSKGGEPIVQNGISLCKIHHAAFDKNILGINEDYRIEVRKDILEEVDGPMLRYGLQDLNHKKMNLPGSRKNYPDKKFIVDRYERFLGVGETG
ncbi:MAG: HNH endonuclease [Bacteroidota bacterium]